jgi:hypothetical protein
MAVDEGAANMGDLAQILQWHWMQITWIIWIKTLSS